MIRPLDRLDRHVIERVVREAVGHAATAARLGLDRAPELRVGEGAAVVVGPLRFDRGPPRDQRFQRIRMAQGELHAEREAADVAPELAPALARGVDLRELAEHALGIVRIHEQRRDVDRPAVALGDALEPGNRGGHALRQHEHALADLAERAGELEELVLVGETRGHRNAVLAVVLFERRGGEADRAGVQALDHEPLHLRHLRRGRRALRGVLAQDVGAHRRVADERGDVRHEAAALEHAQVLRVGLELPLHAGPQRVERHALHVRQVAQREVAVRRAARRDGEAAVADHDARDAERHRRRGERVPDQLRVEVRVEIDDARGERAPLRVHPGSPAADIHADGRDAAVRDRHAAVPRRCAGPVDQQGVVDDQIVHVPSPSRRGPVSLPALC